MIYQIISYYVILHYYTLEASRIQFIQNFEIKQINEMFWICSFIELKKKKGLQLYLWLISKQIKD